MKAVLVFDEMPINCLKCPLLVSNQNDDYICNVTGDDIQGIDFKQSWCPLRPLPKIKTREEEIAKDPWNDDLFYDEFILGYNACLDEITGDNK